MYSEERKISYFLLQTLRISIHMLISHYNALLGESETLTGWIDILLVFCISRDQSWPTTTRHGWDDWPDVQHPQCGRRCLWCCVWLVRRSGRTQNRSNTHESWIMPWYILSNMTAGKCSFFAAEYFDHPRLRASALDTSDLNPKTQVGEKRLLYKFSSFSFIKCWSSTSFLASFLYKFSSFLAGPGFCHLCALSPPPHPLWDLQELDEGHLRVLREERPVRAASVSSCNQVLHRAIFILAGLSAKYSKPKRTSP